MGWGDRSDRQFIFDTPWLDGAFMERGFPEGMSWEDASPVVVRESVAGTMKAWKPIVQGRAPDGMRAITLEFSRPDLSPTDYDRLVEIARQGRAVEFADGHHVNDHFRNPAAGATRKLTRSVASGTVPGADDALLFPTKFYLDGTEDPAAASVSGQTLTIDKSGTLLRVEYVPVYTVIVLGSTWTIAQYNEVTPDAIRIQELIQGSFA